ARGAGHRGGTSQRADETVPVEPAAIVGPAGEWTLHVRTDVQPRRTNLRRRLFERVGGGLKARQGCWPCRPRDSTGVAPWRVHCGTGRLVGPQVWFPSGVRTPGPARVASLGPALRVVLPRLAAVVGRHVEQAKRPVD